jgi:hypothetical protein
MLIVVGLLPALAISALAVSSATAAEFGTSSQPPNSSVPIAETVPVTQAFKLAASGIATIACSKVAAIGASVTNDTNKAKATALRFSSCTDETEPINCALNTVETKPLNITLEDTISGKTVENFKPETGTEITKIVLKNKTGQTCESTANLTVRGLFVTQPENNFSQTTRHPISVVIAEASKLIVYSEKSASFEGTGELLLKNGASFALCA